MSDSILKYEGARWTFPLLFECEAVWATIYKVFDEYGIRLPKTFLYGAPATVWTGGRGSAAREKFDRQTLLRILNYVYQQNAVPTFTFSCTQITNDDLKDEYANFVLDTALEVDSNFIVFSDLLKDYIKSKKPEALLISSVIKPYFEFQGPERKQEPTFENETAYYNKLLKEYDIVVVRPEYSMSKEFLENPQVIDDLSRIEILLNQTCVTDCKRACAHYRLIENSHRGDDKGMGNFECLRAHLPFPISIQDSLIHSEEQVKTLLKAGVQHLKIKGRGEYRYSYDALMLLLAGQMFNQDGPGYFILRDCAAGRVNRELELFNQMVFPQMQQFQQNPQQMQTV